MLTALYLVLLLGVLIIIGARASAQPMVLTRNGWVRGVTSPDGKYDMFLGVPYGVVRKENPFGIADPYPRYDGVFEAKDDTKICPQPSRFWNSHGGSLDCLIVNIYVPKVHKEKIPVMAHIYGGNFIIGGSGSIHTLGNRLYDPKYLLRHDIIFVNFNYRSGPYGFMCPGTKEVPGNTGLKDQLMALRWVKDNIEAFGGDPNRITLAGHSSGSMCVDFHVHFTQGNLFQQAIMQSGNIFALNSFVPNNSSVPLILAKKLGNIYERTDEALQFLSKQNPADVIKASNDLSIVYGPCAEKKFQGVEPFISDIPRKLIPNVKNKKFIIGNARDEYNMILERFSDEIFDEHFIRKFLSHWFKFSEQEMNEAEAIVKDFYIGDKELSGKHRWNMVNFTSDLTFFYPTYRQIDDFFKHRAHKMYFYIFSYFGERNYFRNINNFTCKGAMHADELGYIFDNFQLQPSHKKDDYLMTGRLTTMWANFVKYGNPTPKTSNLLPVKWAPVSVDSKKFLLIDRKLKMISDSEMSVRMDFWYKFYKKYYKNMRDFNINNTY